MERPILADSANYQGKLNGSRKNMYRSIWIQNDQSGRQRVTINELINFSCALINLLELCEREPSKQKQKNQIFTLTVEN